MVRAGDRTASVLAGSFVCAPAFQRSVTQGASRHTTIARGRAEIFMKPSVRELVPRLERCDEVILRRVGWDFFEIVETSLPIEYYPVGLARAGFGRVLYWR